MILWDDSSAGNKLQEEEEEEDGKAALNCENGMLTLAVCQSGDPG